MTVEVTSCIFCNSNKFKVLYSRKDARYSLDQNLYKMNKCSDCGGLYLSPRIPEREIWNYYPVDYYYENLTLNEIMFKELKKNGRKMQYLKELTPGKLLDVGCRDGSFVKFSELFGWNSEGYEFNDGVSKKFNCRITYGDFSQLENSSYDVITLWAVLEHLYHPNEYLEQINTMLKPGGYLIVQIPKFNSFTGKLLFHEDVPRHVTAYSSDWINLYIQKFGFEVIRMNTKCTIFRGSSQGFLIYFFKRLIGKSRDEALKSIYGVDSENLSSISRKIDLFLSKLLDKILRRIDVWGQMTIIYKKVNN